MVTFLQSFDQHLMLLITERVIAIRFHHPLLPITRSLSPTYSYYFVILSWQWVCVSINFTSTKNHYSICMEVHGCFCHILCQHWRSVWCTTISGCAHVADELRTINVCYHSLYYRPPVSRPILLQCMRSLSFQIFSSKVFTIMKRTAVGFEPTTFALPGHCSNRWATLSRRRL